MSTLHKPPVLIVDDNEATCALVTALLQKEFHVQVAGGGAEAVARLKTERFAAILLDLKMPAMDGYAVLEYLRAEQPETLRCVLVFTAALGKRELERVAEFSVFDIVKKPFDIEQLLEAVRRCARLAEGSDRVELPDRGDTASR